MRIYGRAFSHVWKQVKEDAMLFAALFAPILAGMFLRFGMPALVEKIAESYPPVQIIRNYDSMFDLLLAVVLPLMVGFISAMIMLSERDDKIIQYLAVTPLLKKGYLVSRIGIPAAISFIGSILTLTVFHLSKWNALEIILLALLCTGMGVVVALFILRFSSNKVEGMAIGKLSGFLILGMFLPYFIKDASRFFGAVLPSFWLGEFAVTKNLWMLLPGFLTALVWGYVLQKRTI